MRKLIKIFFLLALLFVFGCDQAKDETRETVLKNSDSKKIIVLKAWTIGPDRPAIHRMTNLQEAVILLNRQLEKQNQNIEVKLESEFFTSSWEDYKKKLNTAFLAKTAPDIFMSGHEDTGRFAKKGEVLDLTSRIKENPQGVFTDFFSVLWNAVRFQDRIYGIPQDTEVRGIYYRKDLLKKMGWSSQKIQKFSEEIQSGNLTLNDLRMLAKKAQEAKLVEWGIFHRPSPGVDFFQFYLAFGGRLEDVDSGKLVLNRKAMLNTLKFFYELVYQDQTVPKEMTSISWTVVNEKSAQGKILFNLTAGSWNKAEYVLENGITSEEFDKNIGFAPIPGAKKGQGPITISRPMVYFIHSQTENPDLAFQVLTLASDPELNLRHALESSHLAIRKSEAKLHDYLKDSYLSSATEYLKYARFIPNHELYMVYHTVLFEVIKNMQVMNTSPEKSLERMTEELRKRLGNELIVE